VPLWQVIG